MASEKFCLKWNDYESNLSKSFDEIRNEKDFFDVTLLCEDTQIEAHKLILGACSTFFKNVLRRTNHHHPMLYLKGVFGKDLQGILNFIYSGETKVAEEELNAFLSVAEELQVKVGRDPSHEDSSYGWNLFQGLTQGSPRGQQTYKPAVGRKEDSVTSHIKTEKVFSPSFPALPSQLSPELEDTTSVMVPETEEYDDQEYNQPDFDHEASDENHGWYFYLILKMTVWTFRGNCC